MSDVFSPAERLGRTLAKRGTDRPPVICPGGMMNAAIVDVMTKTGNTLPEAHHSGSLMANLARAVSAETGFENFGVPFCMTVEPEALGSEIDYGTLSCEPKIAHEVFPTVSAVHFLSPGAITKSVRGEAVLAAVSCLAKSDPDTPVIGSLTGPVSTAASLVDPMTFFKELYRDKENSHKLLDYVTEQLTAWALALAEAGAPVISIADPTATGEILGPRLFGEYALPYLNRIIDALKKNGTPVIVHICGDVRTVKKHLFNLDGNALSVDAMVNLAELKSEKSDLTAMGNLSTYLLQNGKPEAIRRGAENLVRKKIDIIAPACGLSTSTPLENIRAFTETVKG